MQCSQRVCRSILLPQAGALKMETGRVARPTIAMNNLSQRVLRGGFANIRPGFRDRSRETVGGILMKALLSHLERGNARSIMFGISASACLPSSSYLAVALTGRAMATRRSPMEERGW
jgi:hypothetical protein